MSVRRRGRTGTRMSSSDAAIATTDWAGKSEAPTRRQPRARAFSARMRALGLASSQATRPRPRTVRNIWTAAQARRHAGPKPPVSVAWCFAASSRQNRNAAVAAMDGVSGVSRQHFHAGHQGQIEQQRRQRGAPFIPQDRPAPACHTNQLASGDRIDAAERARRIRVSPNRSVPRRMRKAMAGGWS